MILGTGTAVGDTVRRLIMLLTVAVGAMTAGQSFASSTPDPSPAGAKNLRVGSPEFEQFEAEYARAIQARVQSYWSPPASVMARGRCVVEVMQLPGGRVLSARVTEECPFDEVGKRSLEAAVLNASPLPYGGFEQVFRRSLRLNFIAPGV